MVGCLHLLGQDFASLLKYQFHKNHVLQGQLLCAGAGDSHTVIPAAGEECLQLCCLLVSRPFCALLSEPSIFGSAEPQAASYCRHTAAPAISISGEARTSRTEQSGSCDSGGISHAGRTMLTLGIW